jgi:hypothetical protein
MEKEKGGGEGGGRDRYIIGRGKREVLASS